MTVVRSRAARGCTAVPNKKSYVSSVANGARRERVPRGGGGGGGGGDVRRRRAGRVSVLGASGSTRTDRARSRRHALDATSARERHGLGAGVRRGRRPRAPLDGVRRKDVRRSVRATSRPPGPRNGLRLRGRGSGDVTVAVAKRRARPRSTCTSRAEELARRVLAPRVARVFRLSGRSSPLLVATAYTDQRDSRGSLADARDRGDVTRTRLGVLHEGVEQGRERVLASPARAARVAADLARRPSATPRGWSGTSAAGSAALASRPATRPSPCCCGMRSASATTPTRRGTGRSRGASPPRPDPGPRQVTRLVTKLARALFRRVPEPPGPRRTVATRRADDVAVLCFRSRTAVNAEGARARPKRARSRRRSSAFSRSARVRPRTCADPRRRAGRSSSARPTRPLGASPAAVTAAPPPGGPRALPGPVGFRVALGSTDPPRERRAFAGGTRAVRRLDGQIEVLAALARLALGGGDVALVPREHLRQRLPGCFRGADADGGAGARRLPAETRPRRRAPPKRVSRSPA